jgi:DNA-directed RNA polymerase specialized sigma24 family protein
MTKKIKKIKNPPNPPKEERQKNEQEYWRSALIESELDSIARAKEADPDRLRKRLVDDQSYLWTLKPETLLCVIDQYYDPKDKEENEDVVNSLSGVLVKMSIKMMRFFQGCLSSDLDKLDMESHINYSIGCMIEDREGHLFARYQFYTFLQRQIIDEFRRSARTNKNGVLFVTFDEVEELINEERRRREGAEVPLFVKQLSARDEIEALLRVLEIDKRKKQAFLLRNLGGLTHEEISQYFHKRPDTIRKWCDEVKKGLSVIAGKVKNNNEKSNWKKSNRKKNEPGERGRKQQR